MRLHYFLNESIVFRSYYRYYSDDWGIHAHTAQLEIPVKLSMAVTLYPSYRYYTQTAATHFKPYEQAMSTDDFYTSDYDLSKYNSAQLGVGLSYTDIFTKVNVKSFGLKSVDVKFYKYDRNSSFSSYLITAGIKWVLE
jgi:hypothetical protein